jgi:hypothetical protein
MENEKQDAKKVGFNRRHTVNVSKTDRGSLDGGRKIEGGAEIGFG